MPGNGIVDFTSINKKVDTMGNILDKTDKSAWEPQPGQTMKKRELYWEQPKYPGRFEMLSKHDLNIDSAYQRQETSKAKILDIARNWSWALFDALTVSDRGNASYWIINGGHRARAAFYRDDITLLPCMLFVVPSVKEEAQLFIDGQTLVSNVSAIDRYTAGLCAEHEPATMANMIVEQLGLRVAKTTSRPGDFKCIGASRVRLNFDIALEAMALSVKLAGDDAIQGRMFSGLFALMSRSDTHREEVLKSTDKLMKLGQTGLVQKINQFCIASGSGGQVSFAKAILAEVNKGKRRKLAW
jgi:hypothetical protein